MKGSLRSAYITGSDAYWYIRRQELEATFIKEGVGPRFSRLALPTITGGGPHKLITGKLVEPSRCLRNVTKNAHLVAGTLLLIWMFLFDVFYDFLDPGWI